MRRGILFLLLASFSLWLFSQVNYDPFVGTWVYQNNDTVFKIKLQKGILKFWDGDTKQYLFGGYSLAVAGEVKYDYIQPTPAVYDSKLSAPSCGIYIKAPYGYDSGYLGFTFYDMEKKHIYGTGLPCNWMTLLAPDKLHWKLNEREGVWAILEGSENDEDIAEMELRGFSVPDDVIMTKEE